MDKRKNKQYKRKKIIEDRKNNKKIEQKKRLQKIEKKVKEIEEAIKLIKQ